MPEELSELKEAIEEKKKKVPLQVKPEEVKPETAQAVEAVDMERVESIVKRMRKKYAEAGVEFEKVTGRLGELRGIIAEEAETKLRVQTVEELKEFRSPLIKRLGGLYLKLRAPLAPLLAFVKSLPSAKSLEHDLYSANMKFSLQQYLAILMATSVVLSIMALVATSALISTLGLQPLVSIVLTIVISGFFLVLCLIVGVIIPSSIAKKRGDAMSAELPFALRHMGTELKAGIGLYKTLQTIAVADYGVLSEEFARTITEIEEGTDTRDALMNMALRTQSRALRSALMHLIRTIKTGGSLSDIMSSIAEDVSFELRMKMRDFAEKMNFFGVIFIVGAIVVPVMIAVLGGVTNAPISIGAPIPANFILLFYAAIMPAMLVFLIFYLKVSQPKV